jgi:hypothetical protein
MIEQVGTAGSPVEELDQQEAWLAQVEAYLEAPEARWETVVADFDDDPKTLLARIADAEALLTQLQLWQARDIARLRERRRREQDVAHGPDAHPESRDDDGWVASEVGWALGLVEGQVRRRLDWVDALDRYPRARRLVGRGRVPAWTAQRLVEHLDEVAALVDPDRLAAVEASTVAWLESRPRPVSALNQRMRRLPLRLRAEAGRSDDSPPRHGDRRVQVSSRGDGCAELWALLPRMPWHCGRRSTTPPVALRADG